MRVASTVRGWWPPLAFLALAVIAQRLLLASRYDVDGHAAEHLGSASLPFLGSALLAILLWATPVARSQPDVLVCGAAWLAATVAVMIGNLRVVDDLVGAGHARTPTSAVPDIADHGLANTSVWYAVGAAVLLIAAFRRRRHIGDRATVAALILTVVVPPWVVPGFGVVVLATARCVARHRDDDTYGADRGLGHRQLTGDGRNDGRGRRD